MECFLSRQLRVRPLGCFAVCLLCGALFALRAAPPLPLIMGLTLVGLTGIVLSGLRRRRLAAFAMLLGACLGMGRMTLAVNSFPAVETQYSVQMVGRVVSDPFTNDNGRRVSRFLVETVNGEARALRLRLYLRGDEAALSAVGYGQRLRLKGHIWENDPLTNPYEFDFGAYLHRNGMDAIATAKIEDVEVLETDRDATSALLEVRHAIGRRIDELFPQSAAVVRALVLGDRSLMSDELRQGFNATGTAHLIAISGLHVTVLAMVLSQLLSRWTSVRLANLLVLLPMMLYGMLIGFPASFVRALTMYAMFGLGTWLGLPSDPITRLAMAVIGFVLVKPLSVVDGGFVLSYSASAGLILLGEPLRTLLKLEALPKPDHRLPWGQNLLRRAINYLPGVLCASLAAQLATLPAVIALFGVQSVVSLPFNLICVPLCLLGYLIAMPTLLISALIYPLGALLARLPDGILALLIRITRFSANLPGTTVRIGRYPGLLILVHCAIILAASGLCAWPLKRRQYLPLLLIAVAGLASLVTWIHCQPFKVTFLDADQADCAVLQTEGCVYVFDTGDTYTPVTDYLNATALKVDGVFLSHPHQDHAGGLKSLLEAFRPAAIYVPTQWFAREGLAEAVTAGIEQARAMNIPIVEMKRGDTLSLSPSVRLTVYNPPGAVEEVNDMSLLLLVEKTDHSVLFTGDLTSAGEPEDLPDCDVLKVAHHGAEQSTSQRFLAATTPQIAVISVGENNHGHPNEMTLRRLKAVGAEVLRTDEGGAITLTEADQGFDVETFLEVEDEVE